MLSETGGAYNAIGLLSLADQFTDAALQYEPDNLHFIGQKLSIQFNKGDYDGYLQTLKLSQSIKKDADEAVKSGLIYLLKKDYTEAANVYRDYFTQLNSETNFSNFNMSSFAFALIKLGRQDEALPLLKEVKSFAERTADNYLLARVYAVLDDHKNCMAILKKESPIDWIEKDPVFENLRQNPEFLDMLKEIEDKNRAMKLEAEKRITNQEFPIPEMIKTY